LRLLGGDGKVTAGNKLTPGGDGNPLYLRNHRLRNGLQFGHQISAYVENAAILTDVTTNHLGEIMPGGKYSALCREDHDAKIAPLAYGLQAVDQFLHECERKSIAPLRPVQGNYRNVAFSIETDALVCHANMLSADSA
jgi:hypothetical protein